MADPAALKAAGNAHFAANRYKEAVEAYTQAIEASAGAEAALFRYARHARRPLSPLLATPPGRRDASAAQEGNSWPASCMALLQVTCSGSQDLRTRQLAGAVSNRGRMRSPPRTHAPCDPAPLQCSNRSVAFLNLNELSQALEDAEAVSRMHA